MSDLPEPTMVVWRKEDRLQLLRSNVVHSNEDLIDTLCDMAHEDPIPVNAIMQGLRRLGVARALLRCPENQVK
jgi:hypothetical protein